MPPFFRFCIVILLLIASRAGSQELPPVTNFDPIEYGAGNQNWMISQGEDDNMYIANDLGLLQFTGAAWNLYPVPNKSIVRSVKVVGEKIFTGAYMEVGFWTNNQRGGLDYTSLLSHFPEEVQDGEQFWHIENLGSTVALQSFEGIYLYDISKDTLSVLDTPEGAVMNLFKVKNMLYFFIAEKGLFTIERGVSRQVIPDQLLGDLEVMQLLAHENGLQLVARSGKMFLWDGQKLEQILTNLSSEISGSSIFSAIDAGNGTLFLGSVENGVYQVNSEGGILNHFTQENGLQNNTVLNLFVDDEKNLWAGLDNGLSIINPFSAFKIFQDNVGKIGTVYTSFKTDSTLYLGTNQGLYHRNTEAEDFKLIEGTNGQVWNLQMVDSILFCGHNSGTFVVDGGEAERISDRLGTWTVVKMKGFEDVYVQGHYNGLSFLKKTDDGFIDLPMLKDFPHSSKHIVYGTDGGLWIGNEHKGVFRLHLSDSLDDIKNFRNYGFEEVNGITSSIFRLQNNLYYATKENVFKYDSSKDTFVSENALSSALEGVERSSGKFVAQEKEVWGFTDSAVIKIAFSNINSGYEIKSVDIPREFRSIPGGYENISELSAGEYVLGIVDGYLIFNESATEFGDNYQVRIDQIVSSSVEEEVGAVHLQEPGVFDFHHNNLHINFSVPEFKKFLEPLYSYRLEGLSPQWSDWNTTATANFKNLPFGPYTFQVRSKLGDKILPAAEYQFEIKRPWHLANLAIVGYLLLLLLLLFLVHLAYKRDREKRIRENEKNLRMRNLEAEQQIIRLQNEQLEKEMAGKSKELAVSTMSLIKKNEFLSNIKERLRATESSAEVRSVIKTIDKDISEEDNWKFFKKAFSNADKDFFKKMKAKHPDLTSNDLKLCAYLRLNLSSKEIAPLLNISVKSVEIKRYRLRKKMELPREVNLVDYILSI